MKNSNPAQRYEGTEQLWRGYINDKGILRYRGHLPVEIFSHWVASFGKHAEEEGMTEEEDAWVSRAILSRAYRGRFEEQTQ